MFVTKFVGFFGTVFKNILYKYCLYRTLEESAEANLFLFVETFAV